MDSDRVFLAWSSCIVDGFHKSLKAWVFVPELLCSCPSISRYYLFVDRLNLQNYKKFLLTKKGELIAIQMPCFFSCRGQFQLIGDPLTIEYTANALRAPKITFVAHMPEQIRTTTVHFREAPFLISYHKSWKRNCIALWQFHTLSKRMLK